MSCHDGICPPPGRDAFHGVPDIGDDVEVVPPYGDFYLYWWGEATDEPALAH